LLEVHPEGAKHVSRTDGFLPLHVAAKYIAPVDVVRALVAAYPSGKYELGGWWSDVAPAYFATYDGVLGDGILPPPSFPAFMATFIVILICSCWCTCGMVQRRESRIRYEVFDEYYRTRHTRDRDTRYRDEKQMIEARLGGPFQRMFMVPQIAAIAAITFAYITVRIIHPQDIWFSDGRLPWAVVMSSTVFCSIVLFLEACDSFPFPKEESPCMFILVLCILACTAYPCVQWYTESGRISGPSI